MKENISKMWLLWFWVPDMLGTGRFLPVLHSPSLGPTVLWSCHKRQQISPAA